MYVDATTERGRNPVSKHHIQPECGEALKQSTGLTQQSNRSYYLFRLQCYNGVFL